MTLSKVVFFSQSFNFLIYRTGVIIIPTYRIVTNTEYSKNTTNLWCMNGYQLVLEKAQACRRLVARMEGTHQGPGTEAIIIIMVLVCLLLTEG